MGYRRFCIGASLSALLVAASVADASPEWKGQIVDAETEQPLGGVVILVYWMRYDPSPGGWAGGEFVGSEEVVTGADGRFAIPMRKSYTIPLVTKVSREIVIFKPGYGQWRIRLGADANEDTVIELPPLKSREDRLKFYRTLSWSGDVPPERMKHLREAEKMERAYLGFRN